MTEQHKNPSFPDLIGESTLRQPQGDKCHSGPIKPWIVRSSRTMTEIINPASKHCNVVILSYAKNLAFSCYYKILHSVQDDNYNCRVNNINIFLLIVAFAILSAFISVEPAFARQTSKPTGYAGSVSCHECHEKFYTLWSTSHHGLAMQPYTKAFAEIEPENAAANFNLGLLMAELGRMEEAEHALMTAFMTDPRMAPAAYNLCIMLAKDRIDEAVGFCKKASEIRPDDPKYAYTLAFYLYQQGNRDAAVKTLNDLIKKHPEYRDAQMLLREIMDRKL